MRHFRTCTQRFCLCPVDFRRLDIYSTDTNRPIVSIKLCYNSDKGRLYYSNARGRFYRYDEKTKEFVSSSGGVVHTFDFVSKSEFKRKMGQDKLDEQ